MGKRQRGDGEKRRCLKCIIQTKVTSVVGMLEKVKIELPYDPAIPLLNIRPKALKAVI